MKKAKETSNAKDASILLAVGSVEGLINLMGRWV